MAKRSKTIPGPGDVDTHVFHAGSDGGQLILDSQVANAAVALICDDIRSRHRARRYAMKLQQKIDRALESFVRRTTAWQPDMEEAEREKINRLVKAMIKAARNNEGDDEIVHIVQETDKSRIPADQIRKEAETAMSGLAKQLPVYPWIENIHGAGALGLATIVAEAGPLDRYPNVAKLWKRLGYAPYDGHAGSTWKRPKWRPRTLTSEEWVANPFAGERYALMSQISTFLIMAQWKGAKKTNTGVGEPAGPYGRIYADRRDHTAVTHPDWTPMHSKRDAERIVMKRFLADLWEQWNEKPGQFRHDAQRLHAGLGAVDQAHTDVHSSSVGRISL